MVIQGFLQLSPGLFAIFYHHALGKTTAKKADDRALSFILGVEICVAIVFLVVYISSSIFLSDQSFPRDIYLWVLSGIFLVEAVATFFLYFRKKSTSLFIPRHVAASLIHRAESAKSRSDTIVLGIVTCIFELIFTLPLYFAASFAISNISTRSGFIFIIAYIIIATIPLFTIRSLYKTGRNLAEIQRSRVKKKLFFRLTISISFLILAVLTFAAGMLI